MNPKRFFFVMLAATIVLAGAFIGVILFGKNLITAEGSTLKDLRLENAVLDKQTTALNQAKRDIAEYSELEIIAKSVVPQDKDQARTVLELVNIANESGIRLTGVNFPASQLGQVSGRGSRNRVVDNNLTQLTPLDSPKGVYSMEIRLDTDPDRPVQYGQLIDFLRRLENNRRTSQVANIQITPDINNRNILSFNLTVISYIKP